MMAFMYNRSKMHGVAKKLPAFLCLCNLYAALLFMPNQAMAVKLPTITQRIYTDYSSPVPVNVGANTFVEITPKPISGAGFIDGNVTNTIEFGYDVNYPKVIAATGSYSIDVKITAYDEYNVVITGYPVTRTFTINYNPAAVTPVQDKDVYIVPVNAWKVKTEIMTLNGLTTGALPENMYLDLRMDIDRIYDFASVLAAGPVINTASAIDIDGVAGNDEIEVIWNALQGTDEYQLEWTFVNDYNTTLAGTPLALSALSFDFKNNSTRVSTTALSYRIPLLFDHGYVLFRLRAVGRDMANPGQYLFSDWSDDTPDNGTDASVVTWYVAVTSAHEASKNWQVTTTFAEEGKKKEVVSYFDGSLRNRQTVTRINSDENVIVGETVYDYQGRPAVTILPTPVEKNSYEPSLHYYPSFNKSDITGNPIYSRTDFDADASGACDINANAMSIIVGASNYYSPSNIDQNNQQSFVPDAQKYPFTQVEYTPDNTGRIRRQGGVGPDFQLDSGHETKYYYGQPNQLQLDRLFGSEVGDAAHYKKNVVIDPNGQSSVSYLDQEGRVIATSLAGDAPTNVEELPSASTAAVTLKPDFFDKNAAGTSLVNKPNTDGNAIEFSTQLTVPYAGNYVFNYDLSISPFSDSCMIAGLCFNCIYDLTINVVDECGTDILSSGSTPIDQKLTGRFIMYDGGGVGFKLDCSPTSYAMPSPYTNPKYLNVGTYTVTKTLKVNEDAVDFYVSAYLDSVNNTCFKTLYDFEQEYLATVDTTTCDIDCDDCIDNLGDRDAFVMNGLGTELEYDFLYEECLKGCKKMQSQCEAAYDMMLGDVTPGGQYAQYLTSTGAISPGSFPLSVLNTNNVLPKNVTSAGGIVGNTHWQTPKTTLNGTDYLFYINNDGTRATVNVFAAGTGYSPALRSGAPVLTDATGQLYSFPEYLDNVSDFISLYNTHTEWAKGLVYLHPEYCYYEKCREYGKKQGDEDFTSDDYDVTLMATTTYADAVSGIAGVPHTGKFIDSGTGFPYDPFTVASGNMYDPFVNTANSGVFDPAAYSSFYAKWQSYLAKPGGGYYNMYEAAAVTVRCGTDYGTTPAATCDDFGTGTSTAIKDLEWQTYKGFYLALKSQVKQEIADDYAHTCYGLNDCIGNDDYNPFAAGMFTTTFTGFPSSVYFDGRQPCGSHFRTLYAEKQSRFPDETVIDGFTSSPQDANYQTYLMTGQCPKAKAIQGVINEIAAANKLLAAAEPLAGYNSYYTFWLVDNNYAPTAPITTNPLTWNLVSSTTDNIKVKWTDPASNIKVQLELDKTGTGIVNWSDITGITNLQSGTSTVNTYAYPFTAVAKLADTCVLLNGSISYDIANCVFPEVCTANQFAKDMQSLFNAMAATGQLTSGTAVALTPTFTSMITPAIYAKLGVSSGTNLQWIYNSGTTTWTLKPASATLPKLDFKIVSTDPASWSLAGLSSVAYFTNIAGAYMNYYTFEARNSSGTLLATIKCDVRQTNASSVVTPIEMGECGLPTPLSCTDDPYQIEHDLRLLLKEILTVHPIPSSIDLYSYANMTSVISSHLPGVTSTTSTYTKDITAPVYADLLNISISTGDFDHCDLTLSTNSTNSVVHIDNVTDIFQIIAYGPVGTDNYYHQAKIVTKFGSSTTDTLFLSTCLPLANCQACPDRTVFGEEIQYPMDSSAFAAMEQSRMETGLLVPVDSAGTDTGGSETMSMSAETGMSFMDADNMSWSNLKGDTCQQAYTTYINAVNAYNAYASAHGLTQVTAVYQSASFTASGFCYCVEGYVAFLNSIVSGAYGSTYLRSHTSWLDIGNYCDGRIEPPCTPPVNQFADCGTTPELPSIPYKNPCVEQLIQNALHNAQMAYEQYIADQTTYIASAYRKHCMGVLENFTYQYSDKEYHFTLYYYDQAGNLVKTIPPAGVKQLSFDTDGDGVHTADDIAAVAVQNDRYYHTHKVSTFHGLATTYEYNSLNQLVRQNMPDHDQMNRWETTLPSGLETGMTINRIQFTDGSRGFLVGSIGTRGLMYTTSDGGNTWQRVNDVLAATINKIYMVDNLNGFAVANDGIVLRTVNGGASWDMMKTYEKNVNWNLYDLYCIDVNTGVFVGENSKSVKVTTAATSPVFTAGTTAFPNSSFTTGGYFRVTSITYDGTSKYIAVARHKAGSTTAERGRIYESTDGLTWTEHTLIAAPDLNKVKLYASGNYLAGGNAGVIEDINTTSAIYTDAVSGTPGKIKDLYFVDRNSGVAIIEEVTGQAGVYSTANGGQSWTLQSTAGDNYNRMEPYNTQTVGSVTTAKLMAVADNGKVARVITQTGGTTGLIPLNITPTAAVLKATWGEKLSLGNTPALAGGDGPVLYFTNDASLSAVSWTGISITPTIPGGENLKRIVGRSYVSGSNYAISAVALSETGKIYGLFRSTTGTFSTAAITVAGTNFTDIVYQNDYVLAIDNTNDKLYRIDLNSTSVSSTAAALSGTAAGTPDIVSMDVSGTTLVAVGKTGATQIATLNSATTPTAVSLWNNITQKQVPLGFTDVRLMTSVYATGVNGNVYIKNGTSSWQQMEVASTTDLNAIHGTGTVGLLAGNSGTVYRYAMSGNVVGLTQLTTGTTQDLLDVVINGTQAGIAGKNGTLLATSNYTSATSLNTAASIGNQNLYGIVFRPSSTEYIAVGQHAHVRKFNGVTATKINQVYTPGLNAVHFRNNLEGFVCGDQYTARHTTDGGMTWTVVKEAGTWSYTSSTLPTWNGVWTNGPDKAFFAGTSARLSVSSGDMLTLLTTINTNLTFYDIAINASGWGYVVGGSVTNLCRVGYTSNYGATWTGIPGFNTLSGILKRVKLFDRNNCLIAAGTNGRVIYGNQSGPQAGASLTGVVAGGNNLNDIYFHDDVNGYIVGDNNTVYKTSGASLYTSGVNTGHYQAGSWVSQTVSDNIINQNTTNGTFNVRAVAMRSFTRGMLGGWFSDLAAAPVVSKYYARKLRDESGLYSTYFYYDRLGRIVASQNTRQYSESPKKFSYTLYDALGRVVEAGEKAENTTSGQDFASVYGAYVNYFYNPNVIDDTKFATWINDNTGTRSQVTRSYYDQTETAIGATLPGSFTQNELRKRIATVAYYDTWSTSTATTAYDHATHYSYDVHGNVKTLLQDNKKLATNSTYAGFNVSSERFKRIDYSYDLISGNVHQVDYEDPSNSTGYGVDQWHHRYEYDADNRITEAQSSDNGVVWDKDARYIYYQHGPLARVELGNNLVQGVDYAYTLQGWIKGVNSNALLARNDMGQDGYVTGINGLFARDVHGYSLNYFDGEYQPINYSGKWSTVADRFEADKTGSDLLAARSDLFNGNIGAMVTTITDPSTGTALPNGMAYKYDQLNRLKKAKGYNNISSNAWGNGSTYANRYYNEFTYDPNGNILTQKRYNDVGTQIEDLSYGYNIQSSQLMQNRLYHVDDNVSNTAFTDDIDDMGSMVTTIPGIYTSNNYSYDAEGRLIKDTQEEIASIVWRVDGKVKEVNRTSGSTRKNLKFDYDAMGQRTAKHIYSSSNVWEKSTYYVRDAQGNVLATYEKKVVSSSNSHMVMERDIYGSSRLGMNTKQVEMIGASALSATVFKHELGYKQYELSNHLGNVLAVVTDRKKPVDDGDYDSDNDGDNDVATSGGAADNIIDYYTAELVASTDYSPFGVDLTNRSFSSSSYRYGFNGMEKDNEVKPGTGTSDGNSYAFEYRFHDSRLGRFLSVDPAGKYYPSRSPYNFAANNPITFIDFLGLGNDDAKKGVNFIVSTEKVTIDQLKQTKTGNWVVLDQVKNIQEATAAVKKYCAENNCVPSNIAYVHHGNNYGKSNSGDKIVMGDWQMGVYNAEKAEIVADNNGVVPNDIDQQMQIALEKAGQPSEIASSLIGLANLVGSITNGGSFISVACDEGDSEYTTCELGEMAGGDINVYTNSNRSSITNEQFFTYGGKDVRYGSIMNISLTTKWKDERGWAQYSCSSHTVTYTHSDLILNSTGKAFSNVSPSYENLDIEKYFSKKMGILLQDKLGC